MRSLLPTSWSRNNPIERWEISRRTTLRWIVWGLGILLVLAHAGVLLVVGIEVTQNPSAHGFLVGLGCILAIFGSHALSLTANALVIPPLIATCFARERSAGTGDSLCLTPLPRSVVLLGKLRPRLEPLVWAALSQAVFVTVGVMTFELWWERKDPGDAAPPLGALASLLWSVAAVATPAVASLWAGLRFRTVGTAVAAAYGSTWLGLLLATGLATVVGWVVDQSVARPRADEATLIAILTTLCVSALGLLAGCGWLLDRCVTQFDEMLAGSD